MTGVLCCPKIKSSWSSVGRSTRRPRDEDSEHDSSHHSTVPVIPSLGTQKSLRGEPGSQPKLNRRDSSHQSPKSPRTGDMRLSMAGLPEDIIITILCNSLTTSDLIAVSHTSRFLRDCSFAQIVWMHAWHRSQHILPNLSPPKFVPPTDPRYWISINAPSPDSITNPAKIERLERLNGRWEAEEPNDLRSRYLRAMRVRYQLRQPQTSVQPVAMAIQHGRFSEFRNMAMTSGGEALVIWTRRELRVVDLQNGLVYIHPKTPASFIATVTHLEVVVADIFELEGERGVLLAAPLRDWDTVIVAFQPLVPSESRMVIEPAPLRYLGAIPLRDNTHFSTLRMSGHHLIVGDSDWGERTSLLRIFDLTTGTASSLAAEQGVRQVEVYNGKYLFYGGSADRALCCRLDVPNLHPHSHITDQTPAISHLMVQFPPQSANFRVNIPRALQFDVPTDRYVLPMWHLGLVDDSQERPEGVSLLKLSGPIVDDNDPDNIQFTEIERASWTRFTADLLPYSGRSAFPNDGVGDMLRNRLSRTVTPPTPELKVVTYNSQKGTERVLSAVKSSHAPYEGFAITELSNTTNRIVHKPLMVRTQNAQAKTRLEPLKQPRLSWYSFDWSEVAGMVAVRTNDEVNSTFSVTIYEF